MDSQDPITWKAWLDRACQDAGLARLLLPPGRDNDTWAPRPADHALAWRIYSELRSRVTTQPLPLRDGDEATALASIVDFFKLARKAVVDNVGTYHAASLMIHALNCHVRPFTARWHAQSVSGHLQSLDQRFRFRSELTDLQRILRVLAAVLGRMSGDGDADSLLTPPQNTSEHAVSPTLPYGVPENGPWKDQITALNAAECAEIQARRAQYASAAADAPAHPVGDAVGLALSGGGIRSATFALGVVEVLARHGMLANVDVMSTVSGGGYLGSFVSAALSDDRQDVGLKPGQQPFGRSGQIESPSVRHLRNHSKYLSEGGFGTGAVLAFSVVYGVLISLLLVAPFLLLAACIAVVVFGFGAIPQTLYELHAGFSLPVYAHTLSGWLKYGVTGALGVLVVLLSISRNRTASEKRERIAVGLFLIVLIMFAGDFLSALFARVHGSTGPLLVGTAVLPVILGIATLWWGAQRTLGKVALHLLVIVGPLFFLAAWLFAVDSVIKLRMQHDYLPWAIIAVLLLYAWFGININFASLHLYYRNRLARTYLHRCGAPDSNNSQRLSGLNTAHKAPLHLINATLNVPGSRDVDLRGRASDFFTFSKLYCGGPLIGWMPTSNWENLDPHLDLGTAMAISGAAAAPRMGTVSAPRYTTLLAMLNVRLGYWLRRPAPARFWSTPPGAAYFLRELSGNMNERSARINLSDGGHLDNLGLYELLRRRCRYIVVVDAEADPLHRFEGLLNALQMAKIDLGVHVEPDLRDLHIGHERFKRAHFVMARINYGISNGAEPIYGLLLVIKLAMTGNESEQLMRFHQDNPTFPHQSTAQQLFSESQFEAYRSLGEHAAEAAFDSLLVESPPNSVAQWLTSLAQKLIV